MPWAAVGEQSFKYSEYFWFVFSKFSFLCSSYPYVDYGRLNGKINPGLVFATRAFPFLTEWQNFFYRGNVKMVPLELYNLLDYEVLAHWIMCDGTKCGTAVILQTQSFTLEENVLIVSMLIHKFNLTCNIYYQRELPVIYITGKSMRHLRHYILPYIIPSMCYKFHVYLNERKI